MMDFASGFIAPPLFEPDPLFREDRIGTAWRIGDQFLARHTALPALGYGVRAASTTVTSDSRNSKLSNSAYGLLECQLNGDPVRLNQTANQAIERTCKFPKPNAKESSIDDNHAKRSSSADSAMKE
jgi:hypothetical protein